MSGKLASSGLDGEEEGATPPTEVGEADDSGAGETLSRPLSRSGMTTGLSFGEDDMRAGEAAPLAETLLAPLGPVRPAAVRPLSPVRGGIKRPRPPTPLPYAWRERLKSVVTSL